MARICLLVVFVIFGVVAKNPRQESMEQRSRRTELSGWSALQRKLNAEKGMMKDDDDQSHPSLPRLEANYTGDVRHGTATHYGGINSEQLKNRAKDKVRQLYAIKNAEQELPYIFEGVECNFERDCNWTWEARGTQGFFVTSAERYNATDAGPSFDAANNEKGHFLILRLNANIKDLHITSPLFSPSGDSCRLQIWIYQEGMVDGMIRIIAETINQTQWLVSEIPGDDKKKWIKYEEAVGRISQDFSIHVEVVGPPSLGKITLVAFDNLKLTGCFPESDPINSCTPYQYRCTTSNVCINSTRICDITEDCEFGDDETQNCDKVPFGARCNFEQDTCGWVSDKDKILQWARHNGSTPTNRTGPSVDHTYMNTTGKYMYVNMAKNSEFASMAILKSVVFNPPPRVHGNSSSKYYNSCMIRFYLHKFGSHKSGLKLQVTEMKPKQSEPIELFWSFNDYGDIWVRVIVILPNITDKYYLIFQASRGIRYRSDVAIDDISMSPECFGINIPANELQGYNYWNPDIEKPSDNKPHPTFVNETYYEITTCNVTGRFGPTQENCTNAYNDTKTTTNVVHAPGLNGVQKWTVPSEGYYTIILLGASGGKGSVGIGSSRGDLVRIVVELRKGQELLFIVGQEGSSACVKSLVSRNNTCKSLLNDDSSNLSGVRGVLAMEVADGGGGGGGATYLFFHNRSNQATPLAVAAGGGGLGLGRFLDTGAQHGHGLNFSKAPFSGEMLGPRSSGAGGGLYARNGNLPPDQEKRMGEPLGHGSGGGVACYESSEGKGEGGFGGGGGGCTNGGGGGGYAGGNSWTTNSTNGEGGYSYVDEMRTMHKLSEVRAAFNDGPGSVVIIPAVPGCECDYRCLALNSQRSQVACICPRNWKLDEDGKTCLLLEPPPEDLDWLIIILGIFALVACIVFAFGCFIMYTRYQHRAVGALRRKMLSGPDLQLNRLRGASDNMITEYNPNYEFGGVVYTVKDLKDIPRNQLQLQKALGQGAFGEVYQGFYRQRSGDAVEMPVAVKTLPAMSTQEAEMDFLMEALIMSKFNHPNIVHFIGVCFDKHPRFIILELLAGGDLKNFLRESRPKPDKSSTLSMKDLVTMSIDVAKGCRYLERNRFIHRDIAARNCLLTTKGPGRVVKIADFGMSRDIYRSDYYRKGGRAMLPIKWMPPEAFLDGIFTSKTDVWSFGVLLWETLSMGYMPYTGCANRQVMQLVTSGGRLEPPANCPGPIYGIMTQCWHPDPEQRPNFAQILERLGYCAQDPDVMNAPLPIFNRPSSQERDATIMRPDNDENCLEVPKSTDYLIPNNITTLTNVESSPSSVDHLLLENSVDNWETSFVIPQSKSTQPLLCEVEQQPGDATKQNDKLLIPDGTPTEKSTQKVSPISLPNNILTNHMNKEKNAVNSLRAGVSLDAGALAKQTMSPVSITSYANVNPEEKLTGNGIISNGPCAAPNKNAYVNTTKPNSAFLNETISC